MSGSSQSQVANAFNSWANNSSNQKSGSSNFAQNIGNQPQYNQLTGAANNLFNKNATYDPLAQGAQYATAQGVQGANTKNLNGGVYGGLNIGNQLMGSLQNTLNKPSETSGIYAQMMGGKGNNYADAMKSQYLRDANRAQMQMQGNNALEAAGVGQSGSSREGVANAMGMHDINQNLQRNMAETGYNTFDKDLQNKLAIAQMADQNTFGRQNLMANMLGQQQGAVNQGIGGAQNVQGLYTNAQNSPWAGLQNYAQAVGGPIVLNSGQSQNQASGMSSGSGFGTQNSSGAGKSGGVL